MLVAFALFASAAAAAMPPKKATTPWVDHVAHRLQEKRQVADEKLYASAAAHRGAVPKAAAARDRDFRLTPPQEAEALARSTPRALMFDPTRHSVIAQGRPVVVPTRRRGLMMLMA